jgi:hypothetical protein
MATQTPFGGLLNYVDKVVDPFKHAYGGATLVEVMKVHEDTFGTGIFGKIADRFPGFNGTPGLVDQISGLPVPAVPGGGPGGLNPLQMAVPFMPRGSQAADDVWTAIYNIKGSYTEKRPTNLQLTNAEQQDLNRRMASIVIDGKNVRQAVMEYYRRPDVQRYVQKRGAAFMEVRTKIEQGLDRVIDAYYQSAMQDLAGANRYVRQRSMLREAANQAASLNDASAAQQIEGQINSLFEEARLRGVF